MLLTFQVDNIRCGGCANSITKKLKEINGIEDVQVKVEQKQVIVTTDSTSNDEIRHIISEHLLKLGYPEENKKGSNNLKTKAASLVSCAIGKVSSK